MTDNEYGFERRVSVAQHRRLYQRFIRNTWLGPPSDTIYAGVSGSCPSQHPLTIAIAVRDTTYLLDFIQKVCQSNGTQRCTQAATDFILSQLKAYAKKHLEKVIGLAMPEHVADHCPTLCSRLWAELDIIPLVLSVSTFTDRFTTREHSGVGWDERTIDEQAESMARKCVRLFGPEKIPLLQVGFMGLVEVDTDFHVRLTSLDEFKKTVSDRTWSAVEHYTLRLKKRKIKIAFFSATPQGGGVALMRHALVRFSHSLGTDIKWYVPKPRPGIFRVTKTIHNILQGVAHPGDLLTPENKNSLQDWIGENAKRYWTCPGGPLLPPSEGGADLVIIDDPQMPELIPIAKRMAPNRPVIFRSHIQIRSDLIEQHGTPQMEVWEFLWKQIKLADCFISHPVSAFVPRDVPQDIVGYMPASTDWLDGLNKNMREWDVAHYGRVFNAACRNSDMPTIQYPEDQYIVQIARFDPSKGIFDVLDSYKKFHNRLTAERSDLKPPKLLICGHGSVDDPDGAVIYDKVIDYLENRIPYIRGMICVMRLRPSDQVLNALLSKATIVLQLSTCEGFEVKVSEAIHKGKPVIATRAGGIPLQVEHTKNGFLVDIGDTGAVARYLYQLWTDDALYCRMSEYALSHVCDEVSTVGNALNWLYLASTLCQGQPFRPQGRWINDLALDDYGAPAAENVPRLKRAVEVDKMD